MEGNFSDSLKFVKVHQLPAATAFDRNFFSTTLAAIGCKIVRYLGVHTEHRDRHSTTLMYSGGRWTILPAVLAVHCFRIRHNSDVDAAKYSQIKRLAIVSTTTSRRP